MLEYQTVPKSPQLNPAMACSWLCKVCRGLMSSLGGCPPYVGTSLWAASNVWLLHITVGAGLGMGGGFGEWSNGNSHGRD